MRRYGPGWLPWMGILFAVGWVVLYLVFRDRDPDAGWALVFAGGMLLATLPGWSWYAVDREGIHRWGATGHKVVPWDDVDAITGRRVSYQDRAESAVFQRVVDARGRTLLELGPWIARRRELARRIREILAHRRQEAAARD